MPQIPLYIKFPLLILPFHLLFVLLYFSSISSWYEYLNCIFLQDKVKKTYKELLKMHKIHSVEGKRIVLKEVEVSDFAVKLKVGRCSQPKSDFRDEAKRYLESLKDVTGDAIDISNLIDSKHRVTFIRGIAGMGKSVLAKQLVYGWANGDIYQNFKMCVMFECRDLNNFKIRKEAELKKHEILDEFIKSKFDYDLGDGEGVLVIVDGLDELYDITEKDSIIGQLLSHKIYAMSKIILTGRPHIGFKLNGYGNMGGLRTVEIQGLTHEQINIYIERFSKREDHILDIKKAKGASNVPIFHVPQFLNTLCCIAILLKGRAISNSTELYCWTLFLLLKEHADIDASSTKIASKIFEEYSTTLLAISKVCHNLLKEKTIIFEGNIKSQFGNIGQDTRFVESLFVDVSDNFKEKYQFKHLSLMEFLSALYICKKSRRNQMKIIKENLKNGFIEVISFACRLLAGFSYEGIIQDTLKNAVGLKQKVNEKKLLGDIIKILNKCALDGDTKLSRSFEIITFFLNKTFNNKKFIKSTIRKCHGNEFDSQEMTTECIIKICRHLESCEWKEDDIRLAFANVQFRWFYVSNVEQLDVLTVNGRFHIGDGIVLRRMTATVNAIRSMFGVESENGYCGLVAIVHCELLDEMNGCVRNDRQLKKLSIQYCQLKTVNSFIATCDWGLSCECFWLKGLDISTEWWERMVEMIEKRYRKGDLNKMLTLDINECTTRISHDMEMRVR